MISSTTRNPDTKTRGFTIVELLIVIVVIAILAAITIVAYNGIQERATNSKNVSEAVQVAKLLESYKAVNGAYPATTADAVCVGDGFKNYVGDSNGDCWDTVGSYYKSVDAAFNTSLATVGSLPSTTKDCIPYVSTACFTGPVYATQAANDQPTPAGPSVRYWVRGTSCPSGQKVWAGSTSAVSACAIPLSN
jgi:prepilin-type N-terminal cleavage/methylation domain-containing protein